MDPYPLHPIPFGLQQIHVHSTEPYLYMEIVEWNGYLRQGLKILDSP
jgi:hypothetical protein